MPNLSPHPLWLVHDSTKLQAHQRCPRKYFFEYVLGWRSEEPNIHLIFGEAWHQALEQLLLNGYSPEAQELAYIKLLQYYRQFFSEFTDDIHYPKTPSFARDMLKRYCTKFARDLYEFKVLYTEVSGRVAIDESRCLTFKTDCILQFTSGPHVGKYFSLEHKTARTVKGAWPDQWHNKIQVHTYNHVLNCMYGPDTYGIVINGAQFQKTDPNFVRLHVRPSLNQMSQWRWEILQQLDTIERDIEICTTWDPEHPTFHAFPRNGEACIDFNHRCQYLDFCPVWLNPLRYISTPPEGFAVNHWNPLEKETTHTVDIG